MSSPAPLDAPRAPSFADLGTPSALVGALAAAGVREPFPIQAAAVPAGLDGRDVCGKAPTGSGKTIAFGVPLVVRIDKAKPHRPTGLVLVPTRELAEQVRRQLDPLARATGRKVTAIYGGVGFGQQVQALRRGVDIVVATPGRLADLVKGGEIDLGAVMVVVVDEADRMADMGFLPEVKRLLDRTSDDRQTLLFSATLDGDVDVLVKRYQHDPFRCEAEGVDGDLGDVIHEFWAVERQDRSVLAAKIVADHGRTIVFCRTKRGAERIAQQIGKMGVRAAAIHGDRSQSQRQRALDDFSRGKVAALVATDVAARGIHVDDIACVVHFDPPETAKDYVHRAGRTGRAGAIGRVISLVTDEKRNDVKGMQRELGLPVGFAGESPTREEPRTNARPTSRQGNRPGNRQGNRPGNRSRAPRR